RQAVPGAWHAVLRQHHALPQPVRGGRGSAAGDPRLPPPELRRLLRHRRAEDPARALRTCRQAPCPSAASSCSSAPVPTTEPGDGPQGLVGGFLALALEDQWGFL